MRASFAIPSVAFALALALAACSQGDDAADTDAAPSPESSGDVAEKPDAPQQSDDGDTSASTSNSAYTQLDLESCRVLDQSTDEGSWVELRCAGYKGTPLFVSEGDLRFDVDAGVPNENFQTIMAFNEVGETVEWRLREGEPFATIIRYRDVSMQGAERSVLAIDKIGTDGAPGCRVAQIAGDSRRANERARAIADADAASFDCAKEPRYIGDAR